MKLTRQEFDDKYAEGRLKLAFIGMSNIGKSYTAMRLAVRYDFNLIEVDKIIWENLGHDSMEAFAQWQGHPYTKGYAEREAESIALETRATREALQTTVQNPMIDTTGSVIYTDETVLNTLRKEFYIVYIEAKLEHLERLKTQYFKQPKPLIWAGHYKKIDGKSKTDSILDAYPNLLISRGKSYAKLADITLTSTMILDPDVTIETIFSALKPAL
ncbi:shikimate kinase [Hellea balneolensis]|uniref:shikimate kinase n=1 Tax=Hellea balneolensis TaxID=287478 RepID=UPI0004238149|nr:shikimate kinase [Hellea balneolensis]